MIDRRHRTLDRLLIAGLDELDPTPTQHALAVSHYEAVGKFLAADGTLLSHYEPVVFPQGSMAIGTATKPVDRDEFDLDFVCQLTIQASTHPAEVKRIVGERLQDHKTYGNMLREKNRCWRLVYAGEFHMDIIPSIPDPKARTGTGLLVPDKALRSWKATDPKGYAAWFLERAQTAILVKEALRAEVEPAPPAPYERTKLPLQAIVQLLKYHRDLMFGDDADAPISIIITTLAALAYDGSQSVFAGLSGVLERMAHFVTHKEDGTWLIENPVNSQENFADKWPKHPRRRAYFYKWLRRASEDLRTLEAAQLPSVTGVLSRWLGERGAAHAVRDYAKDIQGQRDGGLPVLPATGTIGVARAPKSPKHTFYGR